MTNVKYKRSDRIEFSVSGHALAERRGGHDLCCAAASMLTYTFLKVVDDLPLKDKVICFSDGFAYAAFSVKGKMVQKALSALEAIIGGFKLLKNEYPENINIVCAGGDKI